MDLDRFTPRSRARLMSAVGVVAAASCISTGVFALTSDVLPFSGWTGDTDRPDARQLLPEAGVSPLGSAASSALNADGLASTIFLPIPAGTRIESTSSAPAAASRRVALTVRASGGPRTRTTARRSHSTSGSVTSRGDARQKAADPPTAAAPTAPTSVAAVAAASTPAPAPAAAAPATTVSASSSGRRQASSTSSSSTSGHDSRSSSRHDSHKQRGNDGNGSRQQTAAPAPSANRSQASAAPATQSARDGNHGRRGGDNDHGGHGDRQRNRSSAPAAAQHAPTPAAAAAPAPLPQAQQQQQASRGDHGRHDDGGRGGWRRSSAPAAKPAVAPAPTPAPAAAPAPAPVAAAAPAPQQAPHGDRGHDGRRGH